MWTWRCRVISCSRDPGRVISSSVWCRLGWTVAVAPDRTRHASSSPGTVSTKATKTHWIIDWTLDDSEDHDRFAEDDGSGWMRRLVSLRDELLRGDLRPLYLGWLASADALREDALEPVVPPGLAELSPAQQALVEFLEVDADLLDAARAGSAITPSAGEIALRRLAEGTALLIFRECSPAPRARTARTGAIGCHGPAGTRSQGECEAGSRAWRRLRLRSGRARTLRPCRRLCPPLQPRSIRPQVAALGRFPYQAQGSDAPPD